MCGIAGGYLRGDGTRFESGIRAALTSMRHRGPDDNGYQMVPDSSGTMALGQTRLSVIDLSAGGHQPMLSADGQLAVVFNGEIYNYRELRRELQALGVVFRTESDTEVLLAAWAQWGASCLQRLEGMFALAIHDRKRNRLTCARDAFGIKPLFYEQSAQGLLFASEQRALTALRGRNGTPDLQRAYDYLVNADYDSEERSFLQGVRHLMPGMLLEFDPRAGKASEPVAWWRPPIDNCFDGSFDDAVDVVRDEFLDSIRKHLRSDVPLGVTLSGGIDSSAVACAVRFVEPDAPIHTFSYVSEDASISEVRWVDIVNAQIGATPHKVTFPSEDLFRDLDQVVAVQGEPCSGAGIYAQYRIFQEARSAGVTVTLDGQGADELLAGYHGYPGRRMLSLLERGRYAAMLRFAQRWSAWPGRSYSSAWLHFGQTIAPDRLYQPALRAIGRDGRPKWLKVDVLREAGVELRARRPPITGDYRGRRVTEQLSTSLSRRGLLHLLRHGDRNAMAFSIESRVPFLTIPLAELALSLPEDFLISNEGETKHVFRSAMRGIVPDAILQRRDKVGFATSESLWLSQGSRAVRKRLECSTAVPFLDSKHLVRAFDSLDNAKTASSRLVWRWLNYVIWYEAQGFS